MPSRFARRPTLNAVQLALALLLAGVMSACQNAPAAPVPASLAPASEAPVAATATASGAPAALPAVKPPLDLTAPTGSRALEHVRALSVTVGSRPTGSPQEKAAADYIEAQLKAYGYTVEQQPFEFPWEEDRSTLTLAGGESIATARVVRSKLGAAAGELADAGDGNSLAQDSLRGKVALAERGGRSFEEKAAEAAKAGAVALIIFNNREGDFSGLMRNPSDIPVLAISRADGLKLRERLQQGTVRVDVSAQSHSTTIRSQNVVARADHQCAAVIGGHYDSVPEAPGANDNASGTAVMLEVARVVQPAAAARGLCFVAFGGEELGLHGSRAYVQQLDADARNFMLGMINLDMAGVGDMWRVTGSDGLVRLALDAAARVGLKAERFTLPRGAGSDFESFQQANIPNVYPALLDDPLFHTPRDTADRIAPENLEHAARWTLAIVDELTK